MIDIHSFIYSFIHLSIYHSITQSGNRIIYYHPSRLHSHLARNRRMAFIAHYDKVVCSKVFHTLLTAIRNRKFWEAQRGPLELGLYLIDVILVDVCVPDGDYNLIGDQSGQLSENICHQSGTADVEGQPQEGIARSLVHRAREFPVIDSELIDHMAGW